MDDVSSIFVWLIGETNEQLAKIHKCSRARANALRRGGDPRDVAEALLGIARASLPRRRYGAGVEASWLPFMKLLVPQRLFDYLLRRSFGLSAATSSGSHRHR